MFEKIKKWYNTNNRHTTKNETLFEFIKVLDYSKNHIDKSSEEIMFDYLKEKDIALSELKINRNVSKINVKLQLLLAIASLLGTYIILSIIFYII